MRTGDFLGGKCFITAEERMKKFSDPGLEAKLSVISSSIQTTVYSIDEKKFHSLSDNLQKIISDGILQNPYFDEKDIDKKIVDQKEWKKYS